jgi:signal transduction histidine kinase
VEKPQPFSIKNSSADLGFALVVLISYLAALSSWQSTSILELVAIILAGIGYISMGIYGYAFASRGGTLWMRLLYFFVQIPLGGVIVLLGKGNGFNAMVLLPLAAQSVILLEGALFFAANLAIIVTFVLAVFFFNLGWGNFLTGVQIFLAGQIFVIVFTQMVVKEEKNRKLIEALANDLAEANQNLRQYALQVEELTLNKERNRLAREIHDGLGHYLTTIHMHLQAASALAQHTSDLQLRETLITARQLTREALEDVRSSVAALRVLPGEGLPLSQRLEQLLENVGIGIQTQFTLLGDPHELSSEVQWTLYRAAQECLQNTSKHAHAANLWMTLDYRSYHWVRLTIADDGIGASEDVDIHQLSQQGFGLLGLQERLNLMNGSMKITSSPLEGFKIEISVPE